MFDSWVGKICWRRDRLPTPVFLGFPCGLAGKESACNVGDLGSISGLGGSPGEGNGYPLQYSGRENSMDCIGHGVTKGQTGKHMWGLDNYHEPHSTQGRRNLYRSQWSLQNNPRYLRDLLTTFCLSPSICTGQLQNELFI